MLELCPICYLPGLAAVDDENKTTDQKTAALKDVGKALGMKESDIEDLGQSCPGKLQGPCIACPAHTYVFDARTGHCLTDDYTPSARIYSVKRTTSGASTVLWVAREPNQPVSDQGGGRHEQGIGTDEGNAIQLLMVEKALKRRFGDDEDESAKDDDYEFFSRYA